MGVKTKVFFRWHGVHVASDEEVRVTGSCDELGSWDTSQAVPLSRVEQCKNCWWSVQGVRIPLKEHFEYRYAIFKAQSDDFLRWTVEMEEPHFAVATGRHMTLEDDGGRCRATGDDEIMQLRANAFERQNSHETPPQTPRPSPRMGLRSKSMDLTQLCDVSRDDKAFLVFRNLPVVVTKSETGEWQVEKISDSAGTALPLLKHFTQTDAQLPAGEAIDIKVKFIGNPGVCVEDEAERKKLSEILAQHSCIPVFLDADLVQKHNFFAEDYLWPVFHNMKIFDSTVTGDADMESFDKALWKSFLALNNAYAEVITNHGDEDTLVWIHDYELVMVPRFVYHRNPDFTTGLFLHCAFPSTEVMSCLPVREEILQGMLSSRLVTFQTFDYLRHFMSCCSEVLGCRHSFQKGGILQVEHDARSVVVFADHFAIPYNHLVRKLSDEKVIDRARSIQNEFKGKTIIGSYDRFDCFSGLALKLGIFHRFLMEYRSHRQNVVLVQYVRARYTDSKRFGMVSLEELQQMADETNKAFAKTGEVVVKLVVEETSREKQLGVLLATDVLLDTSTNDGLNLIPFNFYAAHSQDHKGVALISEFCGCSSVLTGAFKINPWNTSGVLSALDEAISISKEDQAERFLKDHSYVSSQTLVQWVHKNLSELKVTRNSNLMAHRSSMTGPPHIQEDEVVNAYRTAKKRAIFLDNEGTIAAKARWQIQSGGMMALQKKGQPPDPQVLDLLQTLVNDRGNTVVVLSGRTKEVMEEWFSCVDGLGLCAEHGFHRWPPRSLQGDGFGVGWRSEGLSDDNQEWKNLAIELIQQYVRRIQGSILEAKACAISWNYREVGAAGVIDDVALELMRFLDPDSPSGLLHGYPVKVFMGKGYVEVKRADVDKGAACVKTLEEMGSVDFVLCVGDDTSDEDMFQAVNRYFQAKGDVGGLSSALSQSSMGFKKSGCGSLASLDGLDVSPAESPRNSVSPKDRPRPPPRVAFTEDSVSELPLSANSPIMRTQVIPATQVFTATMGRKPTQAKAFFADVNELTHLLKKIATAAIRGSFSRYSSMPMLMKEEDLHEHTEEEEELADAFRLGRATTASSFLKKPANLDS
ncbi:unnamed protein product [Durusdinium trenchii]|uniref:CBM20 domain-containing protein n=2 Tax=Durusdinium trenchii TaxID=1381693 RepID=A0ABP0LWY0_9DINO